MHDDADLNKICSKTISKEIQQDLNLKIFEKGISQVKDGDRIILYPEFMKLRRKVVNAFGIFNTMYQLLVYIPKLF